MSPVFDASGMVARLNLDKGNAEWVMVCAVAGSRYRFTSLSDVGSEGLEPDTHGSDSGTWFLRNIRSS